MKKKYTVIITLIMLLVCLELYGKSAKDCLPLLENSILKMKNNPKHYENMNPENGWGDYKGALKVLERLYNACVENQDSKVIIS